MTLSLLHRLLPPQLLTQLETRSLPLLLLLLRLLRLLMQRLPLLPLLLLRTQLHLLRTVLRLPRFLELTTT
jgi:hypothetical protein